MGRAIYDSEYSQEGVRAFFEKRQLNFRGESGVPGLGLVEQREVPGEHLLDPGVPGAGAERGGAG